MTSLSMSHILKDQMIRMERGGGKRERVSKMRDEANKMLNLQDFETLKAFILSFLYKSLACQL